ncbi:hypothetical protein BpHYR1_053901 [Brachionus plicatilis]|uniref:Uncharacterized protein n=1 Tax=Brachionus plicatilis TaxID=10195 RepID=A0A3M7QR05_BRAPC|nr:hypothetical protein BpHYR1_053901 [Brachionus plicatilis]
MEYYSVRIAALINIVHCNLTILENEFTRGLLESIEYHERMSNHFKSKDRERKKDSKKNGISDSIKTCFSMIRNGDENGKNLLDSLIRAF